MASALSFDRENDPDILSMIGSSAALHVSHIPFLQLTGSVRLGRINGEFVVMPTISQMEESDLDLIVSGTKKAITMIEGFAREMPEIEMAEAIILCHQEIIKIIDLIEQLRDKGGASAARSCRRPTRRTRTGRPSKRSTRKSSRPRR